MSNELKTPLNSFSPIVTTPVPPFPDHTPSLIGHSINPASGYYGISWPASGSLPHSFSTGGWTIGDRGFQQQTFLGASIRSFNLNGGFGDTSSTLNVELVNDEFNTSDQTNLGYGDDVYHSGKFDLFSPPPVGSPVFFKFGQNFATVEEVYKPTFDKLYKMLTVPDLPPLISNGTGGFNFLSFYSAGSTVSNNSRADIEGGGFIDITPYISGPARGKFHLKFGGILQSYTQNRGPGGDPVYSVQVVDPREILSNTVLILNNYTGSTFNNKNLFNIYGFLEHNLTENAKNAISGALPYVSILEKILVNNSGTFYFKGNDTYNNPALQGSKDIEQTLLSLGASSSATSLPPSFPITGTGFSRRGSQGIPYYRVKQAVQCLMGSNGILPQEYVEKGFGGAINFRGFNYVVDFGSLPDLPDFYYFDFDQINLLDLILEMCDVLSGDLFVTLLPVINHPACNFLYKYNLSKTSTPQDMIHGIIRLDFIDRSKQPEYGAIKTYIDSLANNNIYVENQDVGYELSNVVTDKFIVGAQEVNLYYFTTQGDRDNLDVIRQKFGLGARMSPGEKWSLKTSLKQQLLPYYGMLGNHAVTIPKGFGAYQQILLDATSLNANGVGAYYVATEMELRCAAESYKRWVEFLAMYNDTYMESIEPNDGEESLALTASPAPPNGNPPKPPISNNYAVTVPRSVFPTYATKGKEFGDDGLPSSPCNPPYGYPLYYKRMTKIGVPEGGLTDLTNRWTTTITVLASLKNNTDSTNFNTTLSSEITRLKQLIDGGQQLTAFEQTYYQQLQDLLNNARSNSNPARIQDSISIVEKSLEANKHIFTVLPKVAKKNSENALKIYNFLKKIADECLGKKFLVKIPKEVNPFYSPSITLKDQNTKEYGSGPFGFKPLPVNSGIGYETSSTFAQSIQQAIRESDRSKPISEIFLSSDTLTNSKNLAGGLNVNYNPIIDQYEFNYTPVDQGGYFDFNLYGNILQPNQAALIQQYDFNKLPYSVKDLLTPQDMTNFINEDGKVSPYVRFDNSQDLSLEALGADDFVQQVITAAGPITDLSEALDNIKEDKFHSFQKPNTNPPAVTKTVAFVKCSVDSKLYMPPKSSEQSLNVYAQNPIPKLKYTIPKKIYLECDDKYVDSYSYSYFNFIPDSNPGYATNVLTFKTSGNPILNSELIRTNLLDLDTQHVYALITLPGRVSPTKDSRYRDGPFQQINADKFKHFMTMDTVKGVPGFERPAPPNKPISQVIKDIGGCKTVGTNVRTQAWLAGRKATQALTFASPSVRQTMICPVYPDLIALPLMSHDRCYGPWISSQIDPQAKLNIGGRIEFIKDENLAPWNYSGYDLMNEAGKAQAEFSNSLLLMSERGGFTVPAAPSGLSIGEELLNRGPLITNITVDVSENGVKSTFQLDLYTVSFGKLHKQKQELISKISRERQKLKDERNALVRKGLGKGQNLRNYLSDYNAMANAQSPANVSNNQLDSMGMSPDTMVSTVTRYEENSWSSNSLTAQSFGSSAGNSTVIQPNGNHIRKEVVVESSMQNNISIGNKANLINDKNDLAKMYYNTASRSISEDRSPVSRDPGHSNMAYTPDPHINARAGLYFEDNDPITREEITFYEV